MRHPIRVVVLGTGRMGSAIARLLVERPGLELVGAFGRRSARAGLDVGLAVGLERELDLALDADLQALLARTRPDVAIQATCSRLADAVGEIETVVSRGIHLVSIAEEMALPDAVSPSAAREIDTLARRHGATVLGTGINPGFVLDLLPIVLTGVCTHVESLTATRVNDLSPYGPTVLASQGVGLTPEAFRKGVEEGSVVGHVGFPASIHLISRALGWEIERLEETREPIVARIRREADAFRVAPGQVAGCLHRAVAWSAGRAVVTLVHPQQVQPEREGVETGDTIEIRGRPHVRLSGSPEIPGGVGTVALAVNAIPRVLAAAPGLKSVLDLPPCAALPGDAGPRDPQVEGASGHRG